MPSLVKRIVALRRNFQKIRRFHKNRAVNLHTIMKNRSQRKISFLVVLLLSGFFISGRAQGISKPVWGTVMAPGQGWSDRLKKPNAGFSPWAGSFTDFSANGYPAPRENPASGRIVPSDLYYCQSGFFCKKEWRLEKSTHIPFRFRLGSLDYCDALEGKHQPLRF
jgi:hypothetical protein